MHPQYTSDAYAGAGGAGGAQWQYAQNAEYAPYAGAGGVPFSTFAAAAPCQYPPVVQNGQPAVIPGGAAVCKGYGSSKCGKTGEDLIFDDVKTERRKITVVRKKQHKRWYDMLLDIFFFFGGF